MSTSYIPPGVNDDGGASGMMEPMLAADHQVAPNAVPPPAANPAPAVVPQQQFYASDGNPTESASSATFQVGGPSELMGYPTATVGGAGGYQPINRPVGFSFGGVNPNKRGHSCCGGCCDMRRAVLIVNVIMCMLLFFKIFFWELIKNVRDVELQADDDKVEQEGEALLQLHIGWHIFLGILQMICFSIGIVGALKFNLQYIQISLGSYGFSFIYHLLTSYRSPLVWLIQLGIAIGFAYPHHFFSKELQEGIMTPENYPHEVQSCCCV